MYELRSTINLVATYALAAMLLGGCLAKEEVAVATTPTPPPVNAPPTISGTPATRIDMGATYSFQPNANDADGDALSFSISNRPDWATFNTSTGSLGGSPSLADLGTFNNIVVSVSDGTDSASLPAFSIEVRDPNPGGNNTAPTITGTPASTVGVGSVYSFQPNASDVDGDQLTFSIQNQPGWATFNSQSGLLSGTPQSGDVGVYAGIAISVSDGSETSNLPSFSIQVTQISTGSASLSWTAPTEFEDGTALTNLAGFRIHYGTAPNSYDQMIQIDNAGVTTYVVDNLSPNTYYFVTTAFTTQGVESINSNEATKVIN